MNSWKWFLGILVFFLVLPVVLWKVLVYSKAPHYSGTEKIDSPFLKKPVQIVRDSWGVPHIKSDSIESVFFGLGYSIAQDRLFQMDIQRRLAKGELSEILGEELLPVDKMFRSLLLRKKAEELLARKPLEPQAYVLLDAFLAGVNHFLSQDELPIEFTLLGYTPKPFERIDTITVLAYMGYSFQEGILTDSLYSILQERLPNHNVAELFPRYDLERYSNSIEEDQPGFGRKITENSSSPHRNSLYPKEQLRQRTEKSYSEAKEFAGLETSLSQIKEAFEFMPSLIGSNSWVLAPSRTVSGSAILANDPHIGHSNPGVWYEADLSAPGFRQYGYFLAVSPFPLIAHNDKKAWGLTMLENDDINLYSEDIQKTTNLSSPNSVTETKEMVLYKKNWVPVTTFQEEIPVKGKVPETFTIRLTPHGPIITDMVKEYSGKPLSLSWVFLDETPPLLDILYKLSTKDGIKELKESATLLSAPGLNLSFADNKGNIAWVGAGRFRLYSPKTNIRKILNGGSGEDEPLGTLPFFQNPSLLNPKEGVIATANNRPSLRTVAGMGKFEGNWQPSDRFQRIRYLLSQKEKWTTEEIQSVQTDIGSEIAKELVPIFLSVDERKLSPSQLQLITELKNWDFEFHSESVGAHVYTTLLFTTMKLALEDELGAETLRLYGDCAEHWNGGKALLKNPDSKFWDNLHTPVVEKREDILLSAFRQSQNHLVRYFGSGSMDWKYGKSNQLEYVHPIGRKKPFHLLFNIGSFPSPGGQEVLNNLRSRLLDTKDGVRRVRSGPSTRRIIDMGNPAQSKSILPTGNSGVLGSPFYQNQAEDYLKGNYRTINFTDSQIESDKKYSLELHP